MSIKSLPDDVRNTVRSAYSINNIVHCITELILNSLDANSSCVAVRVNLRTFRIQVIDNGDGISESDMTVIGMRHMTSKCNSKEDLERKPKRHGFKGESLASIISISEHVIITSKFKNTNSTIRKHFEKGHMKEITQEKERCSCGTTVEIEGFMYNIKVRQARIKPTTDLEMIKNSMECLTIINPDVSFSLRNDSTHKLIMSSNKSKTVVDSLCSKYPQLSTTRMHTRKVYRNKISITGLFSKDLCKNILQFLYVNKRPVSSQKIQKLIADLYTKYHSECILKKNAHPVYVINIRCPYSEIDYSFDFAKTTVEFKQWHIIEKCIQKLITNFLGVKKEQLKTEPKPSPKIIKNVDNSGISQLEFAVKSRPAKRVLSPEKRSQTASKSHKKEVDNNSSNEFEPSPKIILHENIVLNKSSKSNNTKTNSKEEKKSHITLKLHKKELGNNSSDEFEPSPKILLHEKSDNTKTNSQAENDCANELFNKFFKKPNTKKNANNRRKQKPKKKLKTADNKFNSLFFKHIKREKILPIIDETNGGIQMEPKKSVFERHQNTQSLVSNTEIYPDSSKNVQTFQTEIVNDQNKGKEFMLDKFLLDTEKYADEKIDINETGIKNPSTYSVVMTHKTFVQSIVESKGFVMSVRNEGIRQNNALEKEDPMKLSKCIQTTFEVDAKLFSKYFQTKPSLDKTNKFAISNFSKSFNTNDITIPLDMWNQLKHFREEMLEKNVFSNAKPVEENHDYRYDRNFLHAVQNSMQTFLSHLDYNSHHNYNRCEKILSKEKKHKQDKFENKLHKNEAKKHETVFKIPYNKRRGKDNINATTKNRHKKNIFDETKNNYTNKNKFEAKDIFLRNDRLWENEKFKSVPKVKNNVINDGRHKNDIFFDSNLQHKFANNENQNYFFQNEKPQKQDCHNIPFFYNNQPIKRKCCLTQIDLSPIKAEGLNGNGKHYYLSPRKKTKHFEKDDGKNVTELFEFSKYFLPIPKGENKPTSFDNMNFNNKNAILLESQNLTPERAFEQHKQCAMIHSKTIFDFGNVPRCELKNNLMQPNTCKENFFSYSKLLEKTFSTPLINDFTVEESVVDLGSNLNISNVMFFHQNHYRNHISKTTDDTLTPTKTYQNANNYECPALDESYNYLDCTVISNNFNFKKPSGTTTMSVFRTQNMEARTQNMDQEIHITCPESTNKKYEKKISLFDTGKILKSPNISCFITNKENEEKISLFDTGNVKCVGDKIITNPNISWTTKRQTFSSTNKENEEKISLFDTGNDKCNSNKNNFNESVGGKIITNPNISCFTTKSNRSNRSEDFWVKKTDNFGNAFYINRKTGMTSYFTPKSENQFNVIKRLNFVPKGRSPMFVQEYKFDKSLSIEAKEELKNAILECYSEELELCEKCIDTKNIKTFLSQIYKDSANKFDNVIPSINKNSYISQNFTKDIFLQLEILGQVDLKYIAAIIQDQKLLLLFDQHAVDERVRVEDLYKNYRNNDESNKLVFSREICKETVLIQVSDLDMSLLKFHYKIFSNFGITFLSHKNYIKILTVPTCLMKKSLKKNTDESNTLENLTKALVSEITECLKVSGISMNIPKVIQNIINSEACRGAVKFGDKLDKENCVHLLKQLAKCNLPFQCAHGRPTLTPVIDFGKNTCLSEVKKPNLMKLRQY